MIVSDAGPIIIFARIGGLYLLREVTGSLLIPDAVYDEIVVKKGGMPRATEVPPAAGFRKPLSQTVQS
jgi:predicted nucleic acid-binding protein